MIGGGLNFNLSGGGVYLLPDTGKTLVHVNANDLAAGTARIGPAWTKNGTVPFNDGGLTAPSSVGPFLDANYFSQPSSSPVNVASGPFTAVVIFNAPDNSALYIPFCTGPVGGTGGFTYELVTGTAQMAVNNGGVHALDALNGIVTGQLSVMIIGMDAGGNLFIKYNGGPVATAGGAGLAASTTSAFIGRYTTTGLPFDGNIYEVLVSTDVPSTAAFNALYAAMVGKLTNPKRYLIPQTANVLTHVNAVDLAQGTARAGGAWTMNGSVPFNATASPVAAVGPFTTSNYFSQPHTGPANIGTAPFTVVMLVNASSLATGPVLFGTGEYNAHGYLFQLDTTNFYGYLGVGPTLAVSHPSLSAVGALAVLMFGVDSSANVYAQLNGETCGITASGLLVASSTITTIGIDPTLSDNPWTGQIYELMVSTDVPSPTAFTNLYTAILANGG